MAKHNSKPRTAKTPNGPSTSSAFAGIDVGKARLDVALWKSSEVLCCANDAAGHDQVIAFLEHHGVRRVGLEASGSYEMEITQALRAAGFEVVVFQPVQVRAYAVFKLQRAKTDPIDAKLIAACTQALDAEDVRQPPDPRLIALAEHLTLIEQITEDIACVKTRRDRFRAQHLRDVLDEQIKHLTSLRRQETALLCKAILAFEDLKIRFQLLLSIQGIGEPTALSLLIRMPELGSLSREKAAALLGVAPVADDSGNRHGSRRTAGGRARPRTSLFAAAQAAARQWNPALVAFYKRLIKAGKPHAVAIVACTRKLIIYANTVLARGTPWEVREA
jgi:transposase